MFAGNRVAQQPLSNIAWHAPRADATKVSVGKAAPVCPNQAVIHSSGEPPSTQAILRVDIESVGSDLVRHSNGIPRRNHGNARLENFLIVSNHDSVSDAAA